MNTHNLIERLARVEALIAKLEARDKASWGDMANCFPLGTGGRRPGWQKRIDRTLKLAKELSRLYRERDSLRAALRRSDKDALRSETKDPAGALAEASADAPPVKPLLRVTKEEWRAKHRDFKGYINGQPYMLRLDPETGATVLVPVEII